MRKIVYGLALMMLIMTFSSIMALVRAQEWIRCGVSPDQVELCYWKEDAISYINISITFPTGGYNVSDWGTPTITGNDISVTAEIWMWTRYSIQVITIANHIYNLGVLQPGEYNFTFKTLVDSVGGKAYELPVESITFTVPSDDPPVGDIQIPIDKFGLLAPYIGLALTSLIATVTTAYVKRYKSNNKTEKQ
ncbi:MAG: hypothetical protein QW270_03310 [Candidatus Bathyarchaeia archaeon]